MFASWCKYCAPILRSHRKILSSQKAQLFWSKQDGFTQKRSRRQTHTDGKSYIIINQDFVSNGVCDSEAFVTNKCNEYV
jgi:hypothetical protein